MGLRDHRVLPHRRQHYCLQVQRLEELSRYPVRADSL